tara:strand:- start:637 stop:2469 length:1833 start_codon:yes stop_codon:yes gene_type:complete
MNNYKNHILFILIFLSLVFSQKKNYKLTTDQKKIIKQAKTLEVSGLLNESKDIYLELLKEFPYLDEAIISVKNIALIDKSFENILPYANKYIEIHNYDESKLPNIFEVYLLTSSSKVDYIINIIKDNPKPNLHYTSKIISFLLKYENIEKASELVNHIRLYNPNFYSLQLGMFYSLKGKIKNALDEYFIYLDNNSKNINIVSSRVMSLADNEYNINIIRESLNKNNLSSSKIILSQLEYKLKNFALSYEILDKYSNNESLKIKFIEDLLEIEQSELAEKIINSIIKNSKDEKIITKAIFLLANLFEDKLTKNYNDIPISKTINFNKITNSPFITINEEMSDLLGNSIDIYDSLSMNIGDYQSTFNLAEIKYKIQGDLDGAYSLYNQIYKNEKTFNYRIKSLEKMIDIYHSKGDLDGAFEKIENLSNLNNKKIKMLLEIKKIQNLFYKGEKKSLLELSKEILKNLPQDNDYYNDILDLVSIAYSFDKDENFKKYTLSKLKLIQNKRVMAIDILNTIKTDSNEINDKIKYEKSYLTLLQGDHLNSIDIINSISDDSAYAEHAYILKGEIYDYVIGDKVKAVDIYLLFLDLFPDSMFYDLIRERLRKIADDEI